ncbi:hypothetical protein PENSUB_12500 [Penicillium subrubescens]|uniref:Uncharacterized protein n=1 Tax=Penicillium subrubescens TaxID=1316194 RepID=A0A1Q5SZJ2_9EURO|nr:hypothetical protein PENSUB_12500 [Penicillium subrubescens]
MMRGTQDSSDVSSSIQSLSIRAPGPEATARAEMKERWEDALKHCEAELSKEDFQLIVKFKSPEELIKAVDNMITETQNASVPRILRQFKPHLSQIQNFVLGILASVTLPVVETVCIWGLISLVLQLAQRSQEVLETVTGMWVEIGNSLQIFDVYKDLIVEDMSLGLALVETHEELLKFAVATIKTLRHVRSGRSDISPLVRDCQNSFGKTSHFISHRIHIIKEKAQAKAITKGQEQTHQFEILNYLASQSGAQLGTMEEAELAKLPSYYIPFSRNPKFYGRNDILGKMTAEFSKDRAKGQPLSVALWATAGVGKTQIALEYAARQRQRGIKAIFWIDAEKESERIKAFNDIAHLLELPGASTPRDSEQNRLIVQRWLQETKTPWLFIIDNLEDQESIQAHEIMESICPTYGCGEILVTCRSELVAASAAVSSIEVPAFTNEEGAELMLKLLDRGTYSDADRSSSVELADLLGGHALTLDVMARNIVARKKQLPEFVRVYKEKPRSLHMKPRKKIVNRYYKREDDPESLWAIPFSQLRSDEAEVLGILSMCGPNKFPSSVLVPETSAPEAFNIDQDE